MNWSAFINRRLVEQITQSLTAAAGPQPPSAAAVILARQAYFWANYLVARFEAENALPQDIACTAGCCYCCCNHIEVTPPEAWLIHNYIHREFNPTEKKRLQEHLLRQLARKTGHSKVELARQRHRFPCPMLRRGRCSIYPVRPLLCRAMHALSRQDCRLALSSGDQNEVSFYAHRYEIILSISQGLQEACRSLRLPDHPLDLVAAVYHLTKDTDPESYWLSLKSV